VLFDISDNNICEEAAGDITTILFSNTKLQELYLNGNNLQSIGAIKIAKALQNTSNLTIILVKKHQMTLQLFCLIIQNSKN